MSWGYRVIIIICVFVIGVLSMVFISMKQTNEVIDSDYYEREMKYQTVIDGKLNLQKLNDSVSVFSDSSMVHISFPESTITKLDSGVIEFLKMSDSRKDKSIKMKPETGSRYELPLSLFVSGVYKLRVEWSNDGINYYQEQDVTVK